VVSTLEEVPGGFHFELHGACKFCGDVMHRMRDGFRSGLDHEMQVVRHPAVRMQTCRKPFDRSCDDAFQQGAIGISEKKLLAMIAAQGDMVNATGNV
jgi:hypothetical protein